MPQAHAATNANLFVSAENSQFNNYFAGPQVIQVIVSDPDINRLDQAYGEPIVTINGKRLRMAQATDGNWYAYFADRNQAIAAGNTAVLSGHGLNFGGFCGPTSTFSPKSGVDFLETKGFTLARFGFGSTNHTAGVITSGGLPVCTNVPGANTTNLGEHVVRQSKLLNTNVNGFSASGQYQNAWPIIQLYDFSGFPAAIAIDYQKSGGDQIVNLTFDRIPDNLISTTLDRATYPNNAQVFATITDPQLNIDPTEEDSWTWGASPTNNTMYYEAFTRNGVPDADGTVAMQNLIGNLTNFMFNHNGALQVSPIAQNSIVRVIDFQANGKEKLSTVQRGDPALVRTASVGLGSEPITFIEQGGVNTGMLGNWDGAKVSNIITQSSPTIRGQAATLKYTNVNTGQSIVGAFTFGSISQTALNNTWASGQTIPVTVTDNDANKNAKITEHLNAYDPASTRIATMKIGNPLTLSGATPGAEAAIILDGTPNLANLAPGIYNLTTITTPAAGNATSTNLAEDEGFSFRPVFTFANTTLAPVQIGQNGLLVVDLKTNAKTLFNSINNPVGLGSASKFKGFDFLNYDLRSFSSLTGASGSPITSVQIFLVHAPALTGTIVAGSQLTNGKNAVQFVSIANVTSLQGFVNLNGTQTIPGGNADNVAGPSPSKQVLANIFAVPPTDVIGIAYQFKTASGGTLTLGPNGQPIMTDFFSVGITGDGFNNNQRINNGVYRYELEETGDNTGVFTGTNQFVMLNQLNIFDPATYATLRTIQHDVKFVAIQDMLANEGRAPQVNYLDLGADGVNTQYSGQTDIPTHTGVIAFDSKTYKIADTVTITLTDADLNVDNSLVDIYTAVPGPGPDQATDTIGKAGLGAYSDGRAIGRLVDIQFGQADVRWSDSIIPGDIHHTAACFGADSHTGTAVGLDTSLSVSQFSLVETGPSTGIFTGTFEIPDQFCDTVKAATPVSTVGQNIKVNYVDFRDDSGKLIEVSDNAGIRGNTGSIKLDKAVYPVPFGTVGATVGSADFDPGVATPTAHNGVFPLHRDVSGGGLTSTNVLASGNVIIHIRVNDQDFATSAAGTDKITAGIVDATHGPVAVQISRQGQSMLLATAGGTSLQTGTIVNLNGTAIPPIFTGVGVDPWKPVRDLGPMIEIAPDAGIFQADLPIALTDGPQGTDCPTVTNWDNTISGGPGFGAEAGRMHTPHLLAPNGQTGNYCVRQGDVLTVTYTDLNDASGNTQTVTDSSTFDLRNGVLQSDKSVYIIGSDMILTLVEPDFNLDAQTAETAPLDLVEWDSHAFKNTMGPLGLQSAAFDAKPSTFVETGKDTGIFQSVIKIPKTLNNNLLERGEQIHLEYTDWGPAGSKTVGKNNQDIELTIYTSNFGATVELDQKVYTWTDRVYTTVVAPDHNFDPNLIDTIGTNDENKVTVSTRGNSINQYQLVETGVDTGIFTGYVILTGDPNVKGPSGVDGSGLNPTGIGPTGTGPTGGFLPSEESDGVSVSFEFTRDQTVTGSALIRWNIGETKWLEASYPANGQGVLQIVDPDMNLNPKAVDKFDTNVWSDSDSGGIKLTMTETGEATGIFQGTVYFTTNFQSSGNRLHVAEGDTVTGEYKDRTLPAPYTPSDQLRLTTTTFIGTIVPPLERAPAANPRIVDSFGNAISGSVKVGQQIQITADLTNGQDRDQPFAYIVQVQDGNGVTVSLSWITGTLTAGQSLNPAQSWTPGAAGSYTAQIFVWQSIDNPNALSPPLSTTINVA
jgi:hypothetical protein